MDNYCVICGIIIPEGRMVCPDCEKKIDDQVRRRIKIDEEILGESCDGAEKKRRK